MTAERMAVYFGELANRVEHRSFDGASLTAVAASCKMDLRQATLEAAGERHIDLFCLCAGITLVVPQHWEVVIDLVSVLSDVKDRRAAPLTTPEPGTAPRVLVRGTVVMGEVTIDD